jgi:hypothetical protein
MDSFLFCVPSEMIPGNLQEIMVVNRKNSMKINTMQFNNVYYRLKQSGKCYFFTIPEEVCHKL